MTRRQAMLTVGGGAVGAAMLGYAWSERRGLRRLDLGAEAAKSGAVELPPAMHSLLTYAVLAPSGHNTQPWSIRREGSDLHIGTDPTRRLPEVDPQNRELTLSMGAFLENLLMACPMHGYKAKFAISGRDAGEREWLRVELQGGQESGRDVLEALRLRRTVRSGQESRALSREDVEATQTYFGQHGHYFPRESREARYLAEGTIAANRTQADRRGAQAEFADWIRFADKEGRTHRDGLTPESMEIGGIAGWYVRNFMGREDVMGKTFRDQGVSQVEEQVGQCAGWVVVTSPDGSLESLLETGRQTERMWVGARGRRMAIHPMTQMLEELPFREQVGKELGILSPIQFLLRVGYVSRYPDPVSLRRPVSWMMRA